jgi:hypothetical protein
MRIANATILPRHTANFDLLILDAKRATGWHRPDGTGGHEHLLHCGHRIVQLESKRLRSKRPCRAALRLSPSDVTRPAFTVEVWLGRLARPMLTTFPNRKK